MSPNILVNVTPDMIEALKACNEYLENYYIAQDLKQYRPQRKPFTASLVSQLGTRVVNSETFKRKRRNVVRDWLYFIVWYVRLRKILDEHKQSTAPASIGSLLSGRKVEGTGNLLRSPI